MPTAVPKNERKEYYFFLSTRTTTTNNIATVRNVFKFSWMLVLLFERILRNLGHAVSTSYWDANTALLAHVLRPTAARYSALWPSSPSPFTQLLSLPHKYALLCQQRRHVIWTKLTKSCSKIVSTFFLQQKLRCRARWRSTRLSSYHLTP